MNKLIYLALFVLGSSFPILGQSYSAFTIPESLSKDADGVVRLEEGAYEVVSLDKAIYTYKKVVTILNANAQDDAQFVLYYDDNDKIKDLEAKVYNPMGIEVESYGKKDFQDYSAIDNGTLYSDSRVKYIDLRRREYPFTVEFAYQVEYNNLYSAPTWTVYDNFEISVEKSLYQVLYDEEYPVRYKSLHTEVQPSKIQKGKSIGLKWEFSMLQGIPYEPFSNGSLSLRPEIRVAPTQFDYGGFKGDASTWDGFSTWQVKLSQDLEEVPEEIVAELKRLVKDLTTEEEKISAVYNFMQNSTRYISVQLGIGGLKPFSPAYVAENGYGDCKALTFYTKKLLEEVGIKSYYSLIYAGNPKKEVLADFPSHSFNHAILFVPTVQDTTWLECTNQNIPAGYLGSFTADRKALVIADDGTSQLVTTPDYKGENNKVYMNATLKLKEGNYAYADIHFQLLGVGTELHNLNFYIKEGRKAQENWIKEFVDLSDYSLADFSMQSMNDSIPKIEVDMSLNVKSFSTTVSDKMLFSPAELIPLGSRSRSDKDRQSEVYLNYTTSFDFSTMIEVPTDYSVNSLPDNKVIKTDFGTYTISYEKQDNGLMFKRQLSYNNGTYPKEEYKDFVAFLKEIKDLEKRRVMLIKNS